MRRGRRTIIGVLVVVCVLLAGSRPSAWAVQVANTFSIRDHVGVNTIGSIPGDRLIVGAIDVTPPGAPTSVMATQGATTVALTFLPQSLFPNQYSASLPFDAALTGAWTITATRDAETASAVTNTIPDPQLIPLVDDLQVVGGGVPLTPTLTWRLPDLTAFHVTRIRIRVVDATNGNQLAQLAPLPPTATSATVPPMILQPGRAYVFRVMLDDVSPLGILQNRSNTFSAPYMVPALSASGTAVIDGIQAPGEWDDAARFDVLAQRPPHDGGGSFMATLYVMNDGFNLYLGLKAPLVARPDVLIFDFDNNNDRRFTEGEDALGLFPQTGFSDTFHTSLPPCQAGFFCLLPDEFGGGTRDGVGAITISGDHVFYELAHPLSSGDRLDFSLGVGDQVGFRVQYSVASFDQSCTTGCFAGRLFPFDGPAGIRISAVAAPVANAGPDATVDERSVVTLDASASRGANLTFDWAQLAGPAVSLANPQAAVTSFVAPALPGQTTAMLTFQVTVHNPAGESSDTVDIRISNVNLPPVADAGDAQEVREGAPVILDGRSTFDPDGDRLAYRWIQVGGPAVTLANGDTATPSFVAPLLPGGVGGGATLAFRLTVSDGVLGAVDDVLIFVVQDNHAPTADAGLPQTVRSGRVVTLDGRRSRDDDGDPIGVQWFQVSGPTVELMNATTAVATFTTPAVGQPTPLTFRLVVSDGMLATSADVVITVVNGQPLCELARAVPGILWPPDHRMVAIEIAGVSDPDNDRLDLSILRVTQDEPLKDQADGNTSPDAIVANGALLLRAERSGTGNGRMYEVTFVADDRVGGQCTGAVRVGVPLSMKATSVLIDDGQRYDSMAP